MLIPQRLVKPADDQPADTVQYGKADDNGKEYSFEVLDAIETDDGRYLAMIPYFSDPKAKLDDSGELVVLKVKEENNEE